MIKELHDEEWAAVRERAAQMFMQCSAEEFVERVTTGFYNSVPEERMMIMFGFFPELD